MLFLGWLQTGDDDDAGARSPHFEMPLQASGGGRNKKSNLAKRGGREVQDILCVVSGVCNLFRDSRLGIREVRVHRIYNWGWSP